MAEKEVRFIRKNGRVIPIRSKDPSRSQMNKNYKKHGDGANQAARIDYKYERRSRMAAGKSAYVGAAGVIGAILFKNPAARLLSGAAGVAGIVQGNINASRQTKRDEGRKENDYVKAFGMGSEGQRPFKKRKKK